MVTFNGGKSAARKARAKSMEALNKRRLEIEEREKNIVGIEKIQFDIGKLESEISGYKYDLSVTMRGNEFVERRLKQTIEKLNEKKAELAFVYNKNEE